MFQAAVSRLRNTVVLSRFLCFSPGFKGPCVLGIDFPVDISWK